MPGREISLSCYMRFLDWFLPIWFNDIHHNTTENYTFVDGFGAPINDVSIPAPAVSRRAIIAPHLNNRPISTANFCRHTRAERRKTLREVVANDRVCSRTTADRRTKSRKGSGSH